MERVVVIGGAGFLGSHIVSLLRSERCKRWVEHVCAADIQDPRPELEALTHGVEFERVDITDLDSIRAVVAGATAVFHCASMVDFGNTPLATLRKVNVEGTLNVIRACQEAGVGSLIYTSTIDVVIGWNEIVDGDDDRLQYPPQFLYGNYAATKAEAETAVLEADGRDLDTAEAHSMRTCVVRPTGLYGEGDPYHVPNTLKAARMGLLKLRIGDSSALFTHTYVGNVAWAHCLAMVGLAEAPHAVAGEAFIVTDDGPPRNFLEFMEPFLEDDGHSLPPRSRCIPYRLMYAIALTLELLAAVARWCGLRPTLFFTRASISGTCITSTFAGRKVRDVLGYVPIVGEAAAVDRTRAWFREFHPR